MDPCVDSQMIEFTWAANQSRERESSLQADAQIRVGFLNYDACVPESLILSRRASGECRWVGAPETFLINLAGH